MGCVDLWCTHSVRFDVAKFENYCVLFLAQWKRAHVRSRSNERDVIRVVMELEQKYKNRMTKRSYTKKNKGKELESSLQCAVCVQHF